MPNCPPWEAHRVGRYVQQGECVGMRLRGSDLPAVRTGINDKLEFEVAFMELYLNVSDGRQCNHGKQ